MSQPLAGDQKDAGLLPPENRPRFIQTLLAVAFLLALLAIIPSPAKFHGDEQFYTDAAVQMVQDGDYWTPMYPNGQIRLLKPIVSYWASAGSMKVLGISLFTARLPFALAGLLTLLVTYQLAKTVTQNTQVALLAALTLASNVQIITLSTRATPDIFVCLFTAISLWGLAKVWFSDDQTGAGAWLFYGGIGLSIETKGLLGLCPLAVAVLFWVLARPPMERTRRLLNWPAMLVGLGIAVFWYGIMFLKHGTTSFNDFVSDQVTAKVAFNPLTVLSHCATYLVAGVRHFLPWTLLLVVGGIICRRDLKGFWKVHRNECLFLILLYFILTVIFSFGNVSRTRYLVAAYPMLAVFLAIALNHLVTKRQHLPLLSPLIGIVGGIGVLFGLGLLAISWGLDWRLAVGGGALLGLGLSSLKVVKSVNELTRCLWMATAVVVTFAVVGACVRPVFSPSPIPYVVSALNPTDAQNPLIFSFQTKGSADALIRLLSKGQIRLKPLDSEQLEATKPDKVITTPKGTSELSEADYEISAVSSANLALENSWIGRLMAEHGKQSETSEQPEYFIGTKRR